MNLVAVDTLTTADLQRLVQTRSHPCISLYAPMVRAGKETRQNAIRMKNLLRQAEVQLAQNGVEPDLISALLQPIRDLADPDYLQQQNDGLALFRTHEHVAAFRLPIDFDERLVVGERFHIKPLLPMFTKNGRFYLLALSQNNLRLFRGTRTSIVELELPDDLPTSLAEALKLDDPEQSLQYHSASPEAGAAPTYHGHAESDERVQLLRYFLEVDRGVSQVLHGETAPLVLAGVEHLLPLYHDRNNYPHLLPSGVTGNPDNLRPDELHEHAWPIAAQNLLEVEQADMARYEQELAAGRGSHDLRVIVPAAREGRIETLFVALDTDQPGRFDPSDGSLTLHDTPAPGDTDLLDETVAHTLLNSGTVYGLNQAAIPDGGTVAAIFHYPLP
jgi:hypothetical protein